jgi:hypothetical protein
MQPGKHNPLDVGSEHFVSRPHGALLMVPQRQLFYPLIQVVGVIWQAPLTTE